MTKRTGEEIRTLPFFQWKDPLAHLEHMEGAEWKKLVQKENAHFRSAVQDIASKREKSQYFYEFQKAEEQDEIGFLFQCGQIVIQPNGTFSYKWKWANEKTVHSCAMVFSEGNRVWAVEENSSGNESYTLVCYTKGKTQPIWKYEKSVGPFLCVKNGLCYVLEETATLRYGSCVAIDSVTGRGRKVIFEEPSLRHNLELRMGENKCIFLLSANSGRQKLFVIDGYTCKRIGSHCISFCPIGYASLTSKVPCFFGRIESFKAPWTAFGKDLISFPIPQHYRIYNIEYVNLQNGLFLYSHSGIRFLLKIQHGKEPKEIQSGIFELDIDPWRRWNGEEKLIGYKTIPGASPEIFQSSRDGTIETMKKSKSYVSSVHQEYAVSQDGSKVPFIVVKPKRKPVGLMVVVYGGYGLPTHIGTGKWKAWIQRGWAVVFGLIRGGGDMGDAWAEDGRTYRKINSIYDTETVIKKSQNILNIPWEKTCIYGRSAGGYTAGALVARHGKGGLIGGAYLIVPYLDVLRTTTNPELPLTVLEYDEFGNPEEKLADLRAVLQLSPVDALPPEGAPSIFVVCRSSTNDMEVLTYESVKWIQKVRGYPIETKGSEEKYLYITSDHGHFVRGSLATEQNVEDYLLFQDWIADKNVVEN